MWFESSGTPQSGQMLIPGPFRLRTSTPDGIRPRIHCYMKIQIFRGRRMDHTIDRGRGAEDGAMAMYSDLVENWPEGSRRHRTRSGPPSTIGSWRATQSSNSRQAADSKVPKAHRKASRPKSKRALSTEIKGSTEMEKRPGKRAAKGVSPAHRSNPNSVEVPDPTEMEVPIRRNGRS